MADDIKDAGAVVGVTRYGVPWHGRIEGGALHTGKLDALGNEITRPWTQPASGDCWLIQKAGMADPYLDAAVDKAADALEGKELTSHALLAGTLLHNTEIGVNGWIYTAPGGQVWRLTFLYLSGAERNLNTTGSFSLTFTRFGRFAEGATESKTVSVSIPHVGTANSVDYTGALPFISDIRPDGSRVAIGLNPTMRYYVPLTDDGYLLGHLDHNPIGFIELTLSGSALADLAASAAVVSNADATVGFPAIQNFNDTDSNSAFEHVRRWAAWYHPDGTLGFLEVHKTDTSYCVGGVFTRFMKTVMTFGAQQIVHEFTQSGEACTTYPSEYVDPFYNFINVLEAMNVYLHGGDDKVFTGLFFYSKTMVRHRTRVTYTTPSTDTGYACVFSKYGKDEDYHPALERSRLVREYGAVNPKSLLVALSDSPVNFT